MSGTMKNGGLANNSSTPRTTHVTGNTNASYRGKFIYLKGRYNKAEREIDALKQERRSYDVLLARYRNLEMMYGIEKQLRELMQEQRNYYANDRDDWRNRTMERNEMLLEFIANH